MAAWVGDGDGVAAAAGVVVADDGGDGVAAAAGTWDGPVDDSVHDGFPHVTADGSTWDGPVDDDSGHAIVELLAQQRNAAAGHALTEPPGKKESKTNAGGLD